MYVISTIFFTNFNTIYFIALFNLFTCYQALKFLLILSLLLKKTYNFFVCGVNLE
jgi:hypothetical protein